MPAFLISAIKGVSVTMFVRMMMPTSTFGEQTAAIVLLCIIGTEFPVMK